MIERSKLPQPWCESIVLDDGRNMVVRPIAPEDAEPLRVGFMLLDPEEIRMRFLHPMKELSPAMARQLCELDRRREFALVVAEPLPAGQALIGAVVRAATDADGRGAEFAILVSHFLAGQGLGQYLMRRVIRWARLKRLERIYGDVLDENSAMLNLAEALGFRRESAREERGIVRVTLELRTG